MNIVGATRPREREGERREGEGGRWCAVGVG